VLVGFVYLVVCRLLALVLLLARSDCSKELEIAAAPRAVDPAAAGAATADQGVRPLGIGRVQPRDSSALVAGVPRHARNAVALAPADRRASLDVPAQAAGSAADRPGGTPADPAARPREQPLGLRPHLRRAASSASASRRRPFGTYSGAPGSRPRPSATGRAGVLSFASTRRRCSRVTSSRSTRSGCGSCTCCSSSRSGRAGSSTSPARATRMRHGWPSKRGTC
jgi:hypothetical protein